MTTAAISAHGTLLKMGDGASSETFTTVAEVKTIKGPKTSLEMEDVTSHSSGGRVEQIPVLIKEGPVTFEMNWVPTHATHNSTAGLKRDLNNTTLRNFQIVLPGSILTLTMAAYVQEWDPEFPVKGVLGCKVTLQPSGAATYSV